MKTIIAVLFLSLAAHAGTVNTIGFEDLPGLSSDWDYNDLKATVSGLSFHTTGDYTFAGYSGQWAGSTETPFASGYYTDFATVVSPVTSVVLSSQTAQTDQAWLYVTGSSSAVVAFVPIPPIGSAETFNWAVGDTVQFMLATSASGNFYSDAALNVDGLPHVVVDDSGGGDTPEPSGLMLLGGGLVALGLMRRRTCSAS